ncbi:tryptophan synthase beta subunit-like PLP-dependent enzyme [Aspergillus alliaceus]|uniref:tryptophan synthase beta subunit-like PLP-dependent enzyme n=1 Tax=Petromyces alliaceus TaxID=209559 RepID=UPI0012A56CED|nr:tryptophan synthase beta subunit-like PLP-dependent enzyme [Aspergillus alliaceus]KAB8238340.1 tryptophan synthase beta subunit-like PLP-dependent enzyme [Aspergillus alliaceus]
MYFTKRSGRALFANSTKQFSTTFRRQLSGLKINNNRLWETLHETCEWGAAHRYGPKSTDTGMARLTLTDDDARMRRWLDNEVTKLGCTLYVDQMGNMFARQKGRLNSSAPMTAMGSHLDTQPRGGRYDGILGVMAALEVLRTMKENGYQTNYDVGLVNWTNEEGARFPKSMCASSGNHGRAVAFVARLLGTKADIFVPRSMDEGTQRRIGSEGARVIVVPSDYDQAVREAADAARAIDGGILVQDTAFEGYEDIPSWIVEGYSTMMMEIDEQVAKEGLQCNVVVTPVGVGSLAHTVARHCKSRDAPVSVVAAEPDSAPCLHSSLSAGKPVAVQTSSTIMDGMNCGTVSSTAWSDLRRFVDACVTISCYESHSAVQYLAAQSITAGPCGAASLAAFKRLAATKEAGTLLNKNSVVVLLCTEGPRAYPIPKDVSVEDPVGLTRILTTINSSNPSLSLTDGVGENQIANYLAAWFTHRGVEHHWVETVSGRPSIVGVLRGSGGGRSLMFNGHIDTVSLSSYEKDALSGALGEKDGRRVVFGRGSLDMKGGLAVALAALSAAKASGNALRGDVIVAAVSDEEDASQGTHDVLAAGWRADAALIPEPTMGQIVIAHKGFVWIEVDILGVAAHGSNPATGQDAILYAGWFLRALEQYRQQLPVDDILGPASLHCGLIQGGEEPSSYPAKCTITVEFRTIPCQTQASILGDLKSLLEGIARENPRFHYAEPRATMFRPTQKLSADHPFVKQAAACATTVLGECPQISSAPFWCDAALLSEAEIPAIVYGPKGEGLHGKEEWVEVESLQQQEKVFRKLIEDFCQ